MYQYSQLSETVRPAMAAWNKAVAPYHEASQHVPDEMEMAWEDFISAVDHAHAQLADWLWVI